MIVTGAKGTHAALGAQLTKDFTGDKNFIYWLIAIGVVGSIGYVESMRTFSRLFLLLIVVAMILKNGGFATQLMQAVQQGPQKIAAPATATGTTGASASATPDTASSFASTVSSFTKLAALLA